MLQPESYAVNHHLDVGRKSNLLVDDCSLLRPSSRKVVATRFARLFFKPLDLVLP